MTRDEAIDLLQVMLLDERELPGLAPKGLTVRVDQPGRERSPTPTDNAGSANHSAKLSDESNLKTASLPISLAWPSLRL